jgi:hypothetical protein
MKVNILSGSLTDKGSRREVQFLDLEHIKALCWSWTLANCPVEFPTSYHVFDQGLEITECAVRLSDDQAPYGTIREDSRQLILNARMLL